MALPATLVDDEFQRGMSALRAGDIVNAENLFKTALRIEPRHVAALNLLGIVMTQRGRFAEAETYLRRALDVSANSDATLTNYGLVLKALKRPAEALERFSQALKVNPAAAETWNVRGAILNDLQRPKDAIADFDQAVRLNPRYAEAFFNRAMTLISIGRYDDALSSFDAAVAISPDVTQVRLVRAKLLADLGRHAEALEGIDALLAVAPNHAEAWLGRSNILFGLKRYEEAMDGCDRALALKPDLVEAWHARGNVFHQLKRYDEALGAYDKALALKPDFFGAWHGRGNVHSELKRNDDALADFNRALAMWPDFAEAWLGRGNVLTAINRPEDAFAAFDRALASNPDLAEAWLGRGNLFLLRRQHNEALAAYDAAQALDPSLAGVWTGRGNIFFELKQFEQAFAAYDKALALKDDLKYVKGDRLHAKLYLSDWTHLDTEVFDLVSAARERSVLVNPFSFLSISSSASDQFECAKSFVADQPSFSPIWKGEAYSHDRIRVAYLSADFRNHPVAQLVVGIFEQHDKSRLETVALSFSPDDGSELRARINAAFDDFIDVQGMDDAAIANLMRRHEIDIAVDLMGFTRDNRFNILARRAAPIQVNYLGYPGTMGASYIDYIIADPTIIPDGHFPFYSEAVVWLPDSYQANDDKRRIAERRPARHKCALPETGLVFCCFNNSYKITPDVFDVWMRLLKANENSVLWLLETNSAAAKNLCGEAEKRGVSSQRLIFAPRMSLADHLARCGLADLFLDTLPYNAHTTGSDALWAGVPMLTCLGSAFAGRVGASLLKAVGLDEMITHSLEDYEALALRLARDPSCLASIRNKLARDRNTAPLFDTERMTRHIEAAYTTMWERHRRGEKPQAFAVERASQSGKAQSR